MAPNAATTKKLLYENDDVEELPRFEAEGTPSPPSFLLPARRA
jgi:hypothetical protein